MARADAHGMEWKPVQFQSMPWETHPIDIVIGPQGWGPFWGPYTPRDYISGPQSVAGMSGISTGYNADPLIIDHGPGYHDITIFPDRSLDNVNNMLVKAQNESSQTGANYTSTISNALSRVKEQGGGSSLGASGDLLARLRSSLTKG